MNERILVPYDDSGPARYALKEALEAFNADEIILLHVVDTADFTHGPEGGAAESLYEAKKEDAMELFEEAQNAADEYNVSLETVLETGQPAEEIIRYAKANDIDHIVIGSHGRSGLSRILLGSVAERVLRNAPVSVMIARRANE
ncbi:universal stress protein [Natronorarus salvus]|uniref:universal stress protein n=1 Tax=Natronorarus salvus TaxID=3117733 RepID=UPI002F25F4D3